MIIRKHWNTERFPREFFTRDDEREDGLFYAVPRLSVHIDEKAIAALGAYFASSLPRNGSILDLMSSWRSHLPVHFPIKRLIGLGLNEVEMRENLQLNEWVVHDLNANPILPFDEDTFEAAVVTVSIQYMTKPVEVFRDVNRILKEGAALHVIYSNRMFPTKAVKIWHMLDDDQKAQLIASYFHDACGWGRPRAIDLTPASNGYTDPVHVVTAAKNTETVSE